MIAGIARRKVSWFVLVLVVLLASAGAARDARAMEPKTHTFTLGPEMSYITYEESDMKETGMMYGVVGAYTYRGKIFSEALDKAMLKLDGHLSAGQVDYDGELANGTPYKIESINDFMAEVRGVAGYDFLVLEATTLTPYFGVGYRYLSDEASKDPAGYDRESNYFYSPLGIEVTTKLGNGWSIGATAEHDFFWMGRQKSYLSDAIPSLSDASNDQNEGYGIRGSIKLRKEMDKVNIVIEPFVRYWDIAESDESDVALSGTIIGAVVEPENTSTEYGVNVVVEF